MKLEKLNENQIRCTLTSEDLSSRKLKLSELAYGSEKAKSLFREMMQQAAFEFGFEANDIPLMIEAIPVAADSLVLIITKVEDPEELDTRFARFGSSSQSESEGSDPLSALKLEGADDILNLFQKIRETQKNLAATKPNAAQAEETSSEEAPISVPVELKKMYGFRDLNELIQVARILKDLYHGVNSVYKEKAQDEYYLILNASEHTPEEFNRVCNIISEYGEVLKYTPGTEAYFKEHGKAIVSNAALQQLAII